jgi:phosphoglycolate phosphatase-like HAD superfamily hydrolase
MNLAIFDVDGTLLSTAGVDKHCFLDALEVTLGIAGIDPVWSHYTNVSDPGLAAEVCVRQLGRAMRPDEQRRLQERYLEQLFSAHTRDPAQFRETPGASTALRELTLHPDWALAIATGGWRQVAVAKLRLAGLAVEGLPAAYGEDGPERVAILRTAIERARHHYGVERFDKVVSIGDAEWDARAAAECGMAFVMVAAACDRAEVCRPDALMNATVPTTDVRARP